MPTIPTLGRRGFAAGRVTARAAGNAVVRSAAGAPPAGRPGHTKGGGPAPNEPITTPQQLSSARAYGGRAFRHSRLVVRDRHIVERRGHMTTSSRPQTPASGIPNRQADGPPRPEAEMLNRSISWQQGTTHTRFLDNTAPHAKVRMKTGRLFPLATQGNPGPQPVYGGTPGLYHPYGARGVVVGPAPTVISLPGGPDRPKVVLQKGAPGDGPQAVTGGAPHGLHSQTYPDRKQTQARSRSTKQMRPGRVTRPLNSKRAGQSMSQFIVPQTGRGGGPAPVQRSGRAPGVTARFVTRTKAAT